MLHFQENSQGGSDFSPRILALILWCFNNNVDYINASEGVSVTPSQAISYFHFATEQGLLKYDDDEHVTVTDEGKEFIKKQIGNAKKWPRPQERYRRIPIGLDVVVLPEYYGYIRAALERTSSAKVRGESK